MLLNRNNLNVTTSWDDGHPLDMRIADALAKHGIRGTFYVPMRNVRPTLAPHQIRDLSSHFEIGAHTVNHVVLTQCSHDQAFREIRDSKSRIEDLIGRKCAVFCFPKGRYDRQHIKMAADAGYMAVRTVELFSFSWPYQCNGISVIPTTLQASCQGRRAHLRNAIKRMRAKAFLNVLRFSQGKNWTESATNLIEYFQASGGVFHLWGHSWEIQEQNQWTNLDHVLRLLVESNKSMNYLTNSELCAVQ